MKLLKVKKLWPKWLKFARKDNYRKLFSSMKLKRSSRKLRRKFWICKIKLKLFFKLKK